VALSVVTVEQAEGGFAAMSFVRNLLARLFRRKRRDRDDASIYPLF
jgi:hypothetical protein